MMLLRSSSNDGVIEGYGDTTFQGDKNITRYEMAQMVARRRMSPLPTRPQSTSSPRNLLMSSTISA